MTDTRVHPTGQGPDDDTPPTGVAAPTGSPTDPPPVPAASVAEQDPPDYRVLYEQALTKLGKAEQTARAHRDKAKRLDEIEAAQLTEAEQAAQRAEQAEQQVTALRRRAVDAEIRAAASGWADPSDAPRYLDDRDQYADQNGEINTTAIAADLAAVLAQRPHLARDPRGHSMQPDPSQGARSGGPVGADARLRQAEESGDWDTAIALKNQRLVELAAQQRR